MIQITHRKRSKGRGMKITVSIIMIILSFALLSNVQISFNPFSIRLPNWGEALCWFGIALLFIVLLSIRERQGYIKGEQDTLRDINNAIEQIEEERRINP